MEKREQKELKDVQTLNRLGYDPLRLLGQGAFSRVYLVKRLKTRELFACKISEQKNMLFREGELLAQTDHPLFPKCFNVWQEQEMGILLMEYVCGCNLETLLDRRGRFSQTQTVRVGVELAEGLRMLHERREPIFFRDVKPSNIVIRQNGRAKLLDLGIACRSGEYGTLAGTPGYAAPEQLTKGGRLTAACDVYGLGKTLQAMAGTDCGRDLMRVIKACTERQPENRIPDMRGVIEALVSLDGSIGRRERMRIRRRISQDYLYPDTQCVKSIWESGYKNT